MFLFNSYQTNSTPDRTWRETNSEAIKRGQIIKKQKFLFVDFVDNEGQIS